MFCVTQLGMGMAERIETSMVDEDEAHGEGFLGRERKWNETPLIKKLAYGGVEIARDPKPSQSLVTSQA